MKFTIVMQSLIADYPNSASNKEYKFKRAVRSVINQTYQDFELIVIADGCDKTVQVFNDNFELSEKLRLLKQEAKPKINSTWSSYCRNTGIQEATGDYILYLDIDDFYEPDYLWNLSESITDKPLYFVDDITLHKEVKQVRKCNIKRFMCGTSNVIHKPCKSRWLEVSRYAHEDFAFIQSLMTEFSNFEVLNLAGYVVCHIPKKYDL